MAPPRELGAPGWNLGHVGVIATAVSRVARFIVGRVGGVGSHLSSNSGTPLAGVYNRSPGLPSGRPRIGCIRRLIHSGIECPQHRRCYAGRSSVWTAGCLHAGPRGTAHPRPVAGITFASCPGTRCSPAFYQVLYEYFRTPCCWWLHQILSFLLFVQRFRNACTTELCCCCASGGSGPAVEQVCWRSVRGHACRHCLGLLIYVSLAIHPACHTRRSHPSGGLKGGGWSIRPGPRKHRSLRGAQRRSRNGRSSTRGLSRTAPSRPRSSRSRFR